MANDEAHLWSSAAGVYAGTLPEAAGVAHILDEAELTGVLLPYGFARANRGAQVAVQARLITAGLMVEAHTPLTANPTNLRLVRTISAGAYPLRS